MVSGARTDELNGYVLEVGKEKRPARDGAFKWIVPAAVAGAATRLSLIDRRGRPVASAQVPVLSTPPLRPGEHQLPTIGQTGRTIEVPGPCDGDLGNASVRVGGRETRLFAESPRKLIAQSPSDIVGPTEIEVREGGANAKGPYRNIAVKLTADRVNLTKGERTTLHVEVRGLERLDAELPLVIQNQSPGAVFQYVFSRLPPEVHVYPTENYYYFSFFSEGKWFWGNMRFGVDERDRGLLPFVYYEI